MANEPRYRDDERAIALRREVPERWTSTLLDERLAEPTHHALDQRVTTVARLLPLSADETREYLARRLGAAGSGNRPIFEDGAVESVFDASTGVPRRINNVATAALIVAAARNRRIVSSLSLTASGGALTRWSSITLTAILSDPDGLADLAGGTVKDRDTGATYGGLTSSGGGTFMAALTWDGVNAAREIVAPAGATSRVFVAEVFDTAGNRVTRELTVDIRCGSAGQVVCSGECVDLQTDGQNCGAFERPRVA